MKHETTAVTADTLTPVQIHQVRDTLLAVPRKNAYHRATLSDCGGALDGDRACRGAVARAYNKMHGAAGCRLCAAGFRRVDGVHVGSQRLGMIPATPCERVFVARDSVTSPDRPFVAYVDGAWLRTRGGEVRRFATKAAATRAARRVAPRMWHP